MHHPHDRLAARASAAERRARALRDAAAADLAEAQNRLAEVKSRRSPEFDAAAAELELAKAQAADQVHGTDTAAAVARRIAAARVEAVQAAQQQADDAAALQPSIDQLRAKLAGAEVVLSEATENTRALVAAAARDRLPAVRQAYRDALMAAMYMATDLWALQALAVDHLRPSNQAMTTDAEALRYPSLGCFGDEHRDLLAAIGAAPGAGIVAMTGGHQAVMTDVARIREELTAATPDAGAIA